MHVKPPELLDRDHEWKALGRFVERSQPLAICYGPRRVGKSFLLDAFCLATGGFRYQAIRGLPRNQLDDLGHALGNHLGVGTLRFDGWSEALDRISQLDLPVFVLDELPYLTEAAPELPSMLQRYVDTGRGSPLVLAGSALSTMSGLISSTEPLYGRAGAIIVPPPFTGPDLAMLWEIDDPVRVLDVDAAVGGLPGYRPLLSPPGVDLDTWMVDDVLAPSSPLLDAAEASLAVVAPTTTHGLHRAILNAIASGERTFSGIARTSGRPNSDLSRPLNTLERAGLIVRTPDLLRDRRGIYDLADPHLRMWLTVIAPHRSQLQAGRAADVWTTVKESTWRTQVLGPRWEKVVRDHLAIAGLAGAEPAEQIGMATISDKEQRTSHEIGIVARRGKAIVALGEAKLRSLRHGDLERLRRVRDLVDAPGARLVLASATGVDPALTSEPDVLALTPSDIYLA